MGRTNVNGTCAKFKIWNMAIYIRLSKEDMRGNNESESITNQRSIIEEHIARFDDGDVYNIVREYVDDGYSGTTDDRKGFQEMLHDIEDGLINCVIVKDLARSFRNYSDQGYYLDDWFPRHDVRFISLFHQALDTYKDRYNMRNIMIPIQGVLNENHCAETSAKIREVFDMKRSKGEYIGGFGPYGYIRNPENKHQLVVDPEAADVVKDIFQKYLGGMSKSGIIHYLNEHGVLCPSLYKKEKLGLKYCNPHVDSGMEEGKPILWSVVSINNILSNRVYCGDMVQGRQRIKSYKIHIQEYTPEDEWFIVENTHEAIIDRETFEKVQTLLNRNTRTKPGARKVYLFSGFLRCGDCGKGIVRSEMRGYVYYYCRTYKSQSKAACTKHSIRHDALEKAVLCAIQQQIYLAIEYEKTLDTIRQLPSTTSKTQRLEKLLTDKIKEVEQLKRYKREIYQDWKDGELDLDDYREMRIEYENRIAEGEKIIERLKKELESDSTERLHMEGRILSNFTKHQNITELTRELLVELVDKIIIYEGGKVEIIFQFADEFKKIKEIIDFELSESL